MEPSFMPARTWDGTTRSIRSDRTRAAVADRASGAERGLRCGSRGGMGVPGWSHPSCPRGRGTAQRARSDRIERALQSLTEHQELNAASGAVHAAAWASLDGAILHAREDVGRHNALDKLIGALLRAGVKPAAGFIVVTSRASFEMAQKATAFGAGLLAAISEPTGLAVRVAEQEGLTLVGFARRGRMTVYTHPQ